MKETASVQSKITSIKHEKNTSRKFCECDGVFGTATSNYT